VCDGGTSAVEGMTQGQVETDARRPQESIPTTTPTLGSPGRTAVQATPQISAPAASARRRSPRRPTAPRGRAGRAPRRTRSCSTSRRRAAARCECRYYVHDGTRVMRRECVRVRVCASTFSETTQPPPTAQPPNRHQPTTARTSVRSQRSARRRQSTWNSLSHVSQIMMVRSPKPPRRKSEALQRTQPAPWPVGSVMSSGSLGG
jgi:hypothetical protein